MGEKVFSIARCDVAFLCAMRRGEEEEGESHCAHDVAAVRRRRERAVLVRSNGQCMSYLGLDDHMLDADPRVCYSRGIESTVEYIAAKRDCCIFEYTVSTKLKRRDI